MYDFLAKVCLNGHSLVVSHSPTEDTYCEKCGAKMISKCPNCSNPIKEWDYGGIAVLGTPSFSRPMYCKSCGKPYPWTSAAIDATTMMIQEDSELSELERKNLEESLPDIIAETPKTKIATVRIKKAFLTCGKFTAETIRQFVIDFGCELAKSSLGL